MLIACEHCHRQYDVGDFEPGSRIRCACGQFCKVPALRPKQVQMLHCSNCGGMLEGQQGACSYCDAVIDDEERRGAEACPECMCPLAEAASFCNNCGVEINLESIVRAVSDRGCPRCKELLVLTESDESSFFQCVKCQGLWLDREGFEKFTQEREAEVEAPPDPLPGKPIQPVIPVRSRRDRREGARASGHSLRCPVCQRIMLRKPFAHYSAIYIDECKSHGFWFDDGEIQEISHFIESGGLLEVRRRYLSASRRRRRRASRRRITRARRARVSRQQSLNLTGLLGQLAAGSLY